MVLTGQGRVLNSYSRKLGPGSEVWWTDLPSCGLWVPTSESPSMDSASLRRTCHPGGTRLPHGAGGLRKEASPMERLVWGWHMGKWVCRCRERANKTEVMEMGNWERGNASYLV